MSETDTLPINIEGELSIFTAAAIRERLLEAMTPGAVVEVDLSRVTEVDSAGVQLIVAAAREAAVRNQLLSFVDPSSVVVETLRLCELSGYLGESCDGDSIADTTRNMS